MTKEEEEEGEEEEDRIAVKSKSADMYVGRSNKSAQSNLGRRPRRGAVAHTGRAVASMRSRNAVRATRWASAPWRSFTNMARLNWLS